MTPVYPDHVRFDIQRGSEHQTGRPMADNATGPPGQAVSASDDDASFEAEDAKAW